MSRKLCILHIIEGLGIGGTERRMVEHLEAMQPFNIEHIVCYLYPKNEQAHRLKKVGIRVSV